MIYKKCVNSLGIKHILNLKNKLYELYLIQITNNIPVRLYLKRLDITQIKNHIN